MKPIAESRPGLSHNSTCKLGLTTFSSLKIEFHHPKVDKDEAEFAKDAASGVGGQDLSGVNGFLICEKEKKRHHHDHDHQLESVLLIEALRVYTPETSTSRAAGSLVGAKTFNVGQHPSDDGYHQVKMKMQEITCAKNPLGDIISNLEIFDGCDSRHRAFLFHKVVSGIEGRENIRLWLNDISSLGLAKIQTDQIQMQIQTQKHRYNCRYMLPQFKYKCICIKIQIQIHIEIQLQMNLMP